MNKNSKIYVAGHNGLVGSAIWNNLLLEDTRILLDEVWELDLTKISKL